MHTARYWPCHMAGLLFAPIGVIAPKGAVPLLLVLATAALVLAVSRYGWRLGSRRGHWNLGWTALACGVAWALLSVTWTLDPLAGLRVWSGMAVTVVAAYVLLATGPDDEESARGLCRAILAGFALALVLVGADQATDLAVRAWYYEAIDRPNSFDPTIMNRPGAVLLLASWPAAIALLKLGWSRLAFAPPVLAGISAFAGVSSSNKLAVVLAATVVGLACWRFGLIRRALPVAAVALVALAPLLPLTVLAPSAIADRFDEYDSGLHRLYIWEFSAERALDRPVMGWGLDASRLLPGGEEKLPQGGNRMNVHPHNAFLQVWLELGAVGAALLALWLYLLCRFLDRAADRIAVACAAGSLVSALVIANLSFGIWQTWWLAVLALTFVLTAGLLRHGTRE